MARRPEAGIILKVDYAQYEGGIIHPYQIFFADGEINWMHDGFLEVIK